MRDRLLRALRGEPVDRTPIWLMRQAGRYLPGYRALRERRSILEIAQTPELAAEVTLEPLRRFDVDAGVIFADITLPFLGLGVGFRIDPGTGPVVRRPVRDRAGVDALSAFDPEVSLGFVGAAIREYRHREAERPLIGFAGAPFTLASYLIEGAASREFPETRRMLFRDPETFDRLLDRLTEATIGYLELQVRAGIHAFQLFDTWVGTLDAARFERHALPCVRRIFERARSLGVPTVYFSTGSTHLLEPISRAGATALGVDWRTPLGEVRTRIGRDLALQGNLDPGALLGTPESARQEAQRVLDAVPGGRGHVFNLGHGVMPQTDPEQVGALVEFVHAYRAEESP